MRDVTQPFLDAMQSGETPVVLAYLSSTMGRRVYGKVTPTQAQLGNIGAITYDGTASVGDGSVFGNDALILDWGPYVLSFGSLRETLTPQGTDILASMSGAEIPEMTLALDNSDGHFSDIILYEDFIGQVLTLRLGFPSLSYGDFLDLFTGAVTNQIPAPLTFTLRARGDRGVALQETHHLGTTSRYASPEKEGLPLPLVYGDFTGASTGVISCPCIDTANHYYLIADHALVVSGNTISVYVDGTLQTSGYTTYTSTTDENGATISMVEFTSKPDGEVTVRCQGKADDSGSLLENPIEILEDLWTEMSLDDVLARDTTAWERAKDLATGEGFTAARVIAQDMRKGDLLQSIMASFLGDWWYAGDGKIVVAFPASESIYVTAGFLDEDAYSSPEVERSIDNLCNAPLLHYAYNSATGEYEQTEEDTTDAESINAYGTWQQEFQMDWVQDSTVAATLAQQVLDRFAAPLWILNLTEERFDNFLVERGDYVVGSYHVLRDENGDSMKNQNWRVLEMTLNLDQLTVAFLLLDTATYYPEPYIIYDGTYSVGSYAGRERESRDLA